MRTIFSLILVLSLLASEYASSQVFFRRAKRGERPPKALLISIQTRKRQEEYLLKYRASAINEFRQDVREVAKRTIRDFSTYFHYCPVYFFIDTMSAQIAQGHFQGVLLDSSLTPCKSIVLGDGDKDFFIGYYGSPIPQPDSIRDVYFRDNTTAPDVIGDDPTSLYREKLIVLDYRFELLRGTAPRTNIYKWVRPENMSASEYRHYYHAIKYNSDKWYIDYTPCAYSYAQTLQRYYTRKKRKPAHHHVPV